MTYPPIEEWIPLDDLLGLERGKRIAYVRKNLRSPRTGRRRPHLTLDEFADAVGAKNRQRPIDWEKGATPRDYADKIADLTPYPSEAFGAAGEAELVRQMFGRRLLVVEDQLRSERDQRDLAIQGVALQLAVFEEALEQIAPGLVPRLREEAIPE